MKRLLFLPATLISLFSYSQQTDSYTIQGELGTPENSANVYFTYDSGNGIITDSTQIVNGKFDFSNNYTSPFRATLYVGHEGNSEYSRNHPDQLTVYVEKGIITVQSTDSLKNATITGSQGSKDREDWRELSAPIYAQSRELVTAYRAIPADERTEADEKQISEQMEALQKQEKEIMSEFISNHNSLFILDGLYQQYLGYNPDAERADSLFRLFPEEIRNSITGKATQEKIKIWKSTAIGQIAPDFTQADVDGNPFSLSQLRGSYVLLDFWASWCGPCRRENPHVVAAFHAYKDKGFTVLGVSLDTKKDAWLKAIEDDQLDWTQLSDLEGWKNAVSQQYGVSSIPTNYLLDAEGRIIEKNLRGDDLTAALEKYLGK